MHFREKKKQGKFYLKYLASILMMAGFDHIFHRWIAIGDSDIYSVVWVNRHLLELFSFIHWDSQSCLLSHFRL